MRSLACVALFLTFTASLSAQAVRYDWIASTTSSQCASGKQCPLNVLPGTQVNICGGSVTTLSTCLASPATTYTSASAGTPCATTSQLTPATGGACLATADNQGNYGFWILPGSYNYFLRVPTAAGGGTYGPYPLSLGASEGCPLGTTCDANYATLALACSAAGSGMLFGTRAWNGLTTQTLACNITATGNFRIKPASGQTVTLSGTITAPLLKIFDTSLGGTVAFTNQATPVHFEWFGAATGTNNITVSGVGDGTTFAMETATTGQGNVCMGNQTCTEITTGNENVMIGYAAGQQSDVCGETVAVGRSALQRQHGAPCGSNTAIGYNSSENVTVGNENVAIGYNTLKTGANVSGNTAGGAYALENATIDGLTAFGYRSLQQDTTGSGNVAMGYGSLADDTTGSGNTGIGSQALNAATTGSRNTAVGGNTIKVSTTASDNTATGYDVLIANTSGASNTALGSVAMQSNTSGSNNVSVGYNSLHAATTANGNTAVGSQSLNANTTGTRNSALGFDAGLTSTTADDITAVGYGALQNNTASGNTALGSIALNANTSGTNNSGLGYNTLNSNTTGSSNTAAGAQALNGNTTGDHNTAVGFDAGFLPVANTTGSDNTWIGYSAGPSDAGTHVFQTVIGSGASAACSNCIVLGRDANDVVVAPVGTVSNLPTCNAAAEGSFGGVNNATAALTAGIGTIVAGGGTNHVPVYCDGTNWRIY